MVLTKGKIYKILIESIDCDTSKYHHLIGSELEFTSEELMNAIITCGMPKDYLVSKYYRKRKDEIMYKKYIVESSLREDKGYLVRREELDFLDQSEKAVAAYYLGMFFTKLLSNKVFHVEYLVHLSIAEMTNSVKYKGKKRPDLIGFNLCPLEYSVFEAKGRQRKIMKILKNAYEQAQEINTINTQKPSIIVANMIYFEDKKIATVLKDPESTGDVNIELDIQKVLKNYYIPIVELINEGEEINLQNEKKVTSKVSFEEDLFIQIGLPQEIYHHIINQSDENLLSLVKKIQEERGENSDMVFIS